MRQASSEAARTPSTKNSNRRASYEACETLHDRIDRPKRRKNGRYRPGEPVPKRRIATLSNPTTKPPAPHAGTDGTNKKGKQTMNKKIYNLLTSMTAQSMLLMLVALHG